MKGASPLVSMVLIIAFSMISLTLVITVLNPVINRAKDSSVIDEATNSLELIYSTIKEVASEAEGAKRTITIRVTDGVYKIDTTKELIYFVYETKGGFKASGISGNVYLEPSPIFFDYFDHYQENSNASENWIIKNGSWQIVGARYYGQNNAVTYRNLGKLKDFEITGKIINLNDNIPGQIFVTPKDPQDLVLYLPFDEGSGIVAWDYSIYNNTGSLINGPYWTGGKVGYALNFTGDDYVNILDDSSLELVGGFTIEFWMKTTQTGNRVILEKDDSTGYSIQREANDRLKMNVGSTVAEIESANTYNDGKWHHVVFVYRGSGDGSVYVDGMDDTAISSPGTPTYGADNLTIGSRNGAYGFYGIIDEVKIWNRSLTEEEVKAEYVLGLRKLIQSGVEQISLPDWINVSLVLSSPYKTYFDNIVVRTNNNEMKLIIPLRNIDLTGSLHVSKGSHQVVIENKGVNTQTNKPIIEISVE